MSDETKVIVLWWRYHDGSGAGVVRAYQNEERALLDMELIDVADPSKVFELVTVAFFK